VFCQLGRTGRKTLERKIYFPTAEIITEIDDWLKSDGHADYMTRSGSGEPTLHSDFGQVLDYLRNQSIPSALLTNGSLLHLTEVRKAAALASVVKVSLCAWNQASFEWVNRPHWQLDFNIIFGGLQQFRKEYKGQLWLEVFLLSGINAMHRDVEKIAALSRELKPDRIHLNTITRPPAEDFAMAVAIPQLENLSKLFDPPAMIAVKINITQSKTVKANQSKVMAMLKRRPCTLKQIEAVFDLHINELAKILGQLLKQKKICVDLRDQEVYYRCI
jgi:wyosine [tRNA(Phe)-imidazoG37] synthetase (radical SAM superfamily)